MLTATKTMPRAPHAPHPRALPEDRRCARSHLRNVRATDPGLVLAGCQLLGLTRVLEAGDDVEDALVDFVREHLRITRDECSTDRGIQHLVEADLHEYIVAIDITEGVWLHDATADALAFNNFDGEVGFEAKAWLECVITCRDGGRDGGCVRHWAIFVIDGLEAPL